MKDQASGRPSGEMPAPVHLATLSPSGPIDHEGDPARAELRGAWVPVRTPRLEVRWFTDADLPRPLRPRGPSLKRIDAYHVDSLSPECSVKRRGDTERLERKTRSGAVPVDIGRVDAYAERWQKWLAPKPASLQLDGAWVDVRKQIWSLSGIEVVRVSVGDRWWWSLAFAITSAGERSLIERASPWLDRFDETTRSISYAGWLRSALPVSSHAADPPGDEVAARV